MWLRQARQLTPPGRVDITASCASGGWLISQQQGCGWRRSRGALELLKLEDDIEEEEDEA
jgi:hypothetical protein